MVRLIFHLLEILNVTLYGVKVIATHCPVDITLSRAGNLRGPESAYAHRNAKKSHFPYSDVGSTSQATFPRRINSPPAKGQEVVSGCGWEHPLRGGVGERPHGERRGRPSQEAVGAVHMVDRRQGGTGARGQRRRTKSDPRLTLCPGRSRGPRGEGVAGGHAGTGAEPPPLRADEGDRRGGELTDVQDPGSSLSLRNYSRQRVWGHRGLCGK